MEGKTSGACCACAPFAASRVTAKTTRIERLTILTPFSSKRAQGEADLMGTTPSHSSRVEEKRLRNLGGANESHAGEANGTLAHAALEVVDKPLHDGGSAVAKAGNRRGHTGGKGDALGEPAG